MASDYPYVGVYKKIPTLFERVATVGIPPKVDDKWLGQYGLTSSIDRRLKSVLRFVGFTDAGGVPTSLWRDYRGTHGRAKLAEAIQASYADLYHAIPNAHLASSEAITRYFRSNSSLGPDAVSQAVNTFKSLVNIADFSSAGTTAHTAPIPSSNGASAEPGHDGVTQEEEVFGRRIQGPEVTINVNLQLSLPESKDPAVYDALFAALAKHILPNNA